MKKLYFLSILLLASVANAQTNVGITGNVDGVYINELHYDNVGGDVGEFFEVAGPAGTDLSLYTVTLYNGSGNASYATYPLSGLIDNEGAGVGAIHVALAVNGFQNGSPDGIALSKTGSTDVQFLSYEGVMTAVGGPAAGLTSADILVSEDGTNAIGTSLEYDEGSMTWIAIADDTPGDFAQGAVLSTRSFSAIDGLKMYPNPLSGNVLNFSTTLNAELNVQIFDILGKQVVNSKVSNNTLNVSNLNAGVYIVKVTEEGKTATRKLVVR
ncbi:MAG: hypothetical protein ACJAYP_000626 [Flavobacterium sp.]|jgi:hypothetical protein